MYKRPRVIKYIQKNQTDVKPTNFIGFIDNKQKSIQKRQKQRQKDNRQTIKIHGKFAQLLDIHKNNNKQQQKKQQEHKHDKQFFKQKIPLTAMKFQSDFNISDDDDEAKNNIFDSYKKKFEDIKLVMPKKLKPQKIVEDIKSFLLTQLKRKKQTISLEQIHSLPIMQQILGSGGQNKKTVKFIPKKQIKQNEQKMIIKNTNIINEQQNINQKNINEKFGQKLEIRNYNHDHYQKYKQDYPIDNSFLFKHDNPYYNEEQIDLEQLNKEIYDESDSQDQQNIKYFYQKIQEQEMNQNQLKQIIKNRNIRDNYFMNNHGDQLFLNKKSKKQQYNNRYSQNPQSIHQSINNQFSQMVPLNNDSHNNMNNMRLFQRLNKNKSKGIKYYEQKSQFQKFLNNDF